MLVGSVERASVEGMKVGCCELCKNMGEILNCEGRN